MHIAEEDWKVLTLLLPTGWQQMASQSGAIERWRGFPSPGVLLRMLLLHVALGYSLRETVLRAKLANWTHISDVALLKRLRNSEGWLRWLCIELLRENVAYRCEQGMIRTIRIVDGTIVREPGKTGSQWRILHSIRLPSLVCDFFEVTATIGEGSGESLKRLPVSPRELILADAQLGHVPKHDDRSSRAWLYGKMLVTLLAQKLIRIGRDISPSGGLLFARRTPHSLA